MSRSLGDAPGVLDTSTGASHSPAGVPDAASTSAPDVQTTVALPSGSSATRGALPGAEIVAGCSHEPDAADPRATRTLPSSSQATIAAPAALTARLGPDNTAEPGSDRRRGAPQTPDGRTSTSTLYEPPPPRSAHAATASPAASTATWCSRMRSATTERSFGFGQLPAGPRRIVACRTRSAPMSWIQETIASPAEFTATWGSDPTPGRPSSTGGPQAAPGSRETASTM